MFRGLFFISRFSAFFGRLPFRGKLPKNPVIAASDFVLFLVAFFCKNLNFRLSLRGGVFRNAAPLCMA